MGVFDRKLDKQDKQEKLKGNALGTTAMRYLYLESPKGKEDKRKLKKEDKASSALSSTSPLFRWAAPLESSKQSFPSQTSEGSDKVKLLNKFASKNIFNMPISELDDNIRKYTKSPLVVDGIAGALTGAGYWAFDRFINPPNTKKLQDKAVAMYEKDGGSKPIEYYVDKANKADSRRRLLYSLAAGTAGAGLAASLQYNPAYPDSWRKFVPKYGVRKYASMFGPPTHMSANAIRNAVMANPSIPQQTKSEIMDMLRTLPNGPLTSTDVINASIRTGAAARAGKPLGRIAVAAVADAATAYAAGRALGVGSPGRLATIAGIGSAAYRYMF